MGVIPAYAAARAGVEGASASITDNDPYFKALQAEMADAAAELEEEVAETIASAGFCPPSRTRQASSSALRP